jgi:putative copper resistance protein D
LVNAWLLVGDLPALIATSYGRLVSTKVALFAMMLAIAAVNRFKLTPRLRADVSRDDTSQAALHHLWRNVIAEVCLGAAILSIVGVLGAMPPSTHGHGDMPHHMHSDTR